MPDYWKAMTHPGFGKLSESQRHELFNLAASSEPGWANLDRDQRLKLRQQFIPEMTAGLGGGLPEPAVTETPVPTTTPTPTPSPDVTVPGGIRPTGMMGGLGTGTMVTPTPGPAPDLVSAHRAGLPGEMAVPTHDLEITPSGPIAKPLEDQEMDLVLDGPVQARPDLIPSHKPVDVAKETRIAAAQTDQDRMFRIVKDAGIEWEELDADQREHITKLYLEGTTPEPQGKQLEELVAKAGKGAADPLPPPPGGQTIASIAEELVQKLASETAQRLAQSGLENEWLRAAGTAVARGAGAAAGAGEYGLAKLPELFGATLGPGVPGIPPTAGAEVMAPISDATGDFAQEMRDIGQMTTTREPGDEFRLTDIVTEPIPALKTAIEETGPMMVMIAPAMAAAALGGSAGPWGATVAAALTARAIESAMEAGDGMSVAEEMGYSRQEQIAIADRVFAGNMSLAGMDVAEFGILFLGLERFGAPGKAVQRLLLRMKPAGLRRVTGGTLRVLLGSAAEGLEEGLQAEIHEWARGEGFSPKDVLTDHTEEKHVGALLGLIFTGGGISVQAAFDAEGRKFQDFRDRVLDSATHTPEQLRQMARGFEEGHPARDGYEGLASALEERQRVRAERGEEPIEPQELPAQAAEPLPPEEIEAIEAEAAGVPPVEPEVAPVEEPVEVIPEAEAGQEIPVEPAEGAPAATAEPQLVAAEASLARGRAAKVEGVPNDPERFKMESPPDSTITTSVIEKDGEFAVLRHEHVTMPEDSPVADFNERTRVAGFGSREEAGSYALQYLSHRLTGSPAPTAPEVTPEAPPVAEKTEHQKTALRGIAQTLERTGKTELLKDVSLIDPTTLSEDDQKLAEYARERGVETVFFDAPREVGFNGFHGRGFIGIRRSDHRDNHVAQVVAHELFGHELEARDPEAWNRIRELVVETAPDLYNAIETEVRRKYKTFHNKPITEEGVAAETMAWLAQTNASAIFEAISNPKIAEQLASGRADEVTVRILEWLQDIMTKVAEKLGRPVGLTNAEIRANKAVPAKLGLEFARAMANLKVRAEPAVSPAPEAAPEPVTPTPEAPAAEPAPAEAAPAPPRTEIPVRQLKAEDVGDEGFTIDLSGREYSVRVEDGKYVLESPVGERKEYTIFRKLKVDLIKEDQRWKPKPTPPTEPIEKGTRVRLPNGYEGEVRMVLKDGAVQIATKTPMGVQQFVEKIENLEVVKEPTVPPGPTPEAAPEPEAAPTAPEPAKPKAAPAEEIDAEETLASAMTEFVHKGSTDVEVPLGDTTIRRRYTYLDPDKFPMVQPGLHHVRVEAGGVEGGRVTTIIEGDESGRRFPSKQDAERWVRSDLRKRLGVEKPPKWGKPKAEKKAPPKEEAPFPKGEDIESIEYGDESTDAGTKTRQVWVKVRGDDSIHGHPMTIRLVKGKYDAGWRIVFRVALPTGESVKIGDETYQRSTGIYLRAEDDPVPKDVIRVSDDFEITAPYEDADLKITKARLRSLLADGRILPRDETVSLGYGHEVQVGDLVEAGLIPEGMVYDLVLEPYDPGADVKLPTQKQIDGLTDTSDPKAHHFAWVGDLTGTASKWVTDGKLLVPAAEAQNKSLLNKLRRLTGRGVSKLDQEKETGRLRESSAKSTWDRNVKAEDQVEYEVLGVAGGRFGQFVILREKGTSASEASKEQYMAVRLSKLQLIDQLTGGRVAKMTAVPGGKNPVILRTNRNKPIAVAMPFTYVPPGALSTAIRTDSRIGEQVSFQRLASKLKPGEIADAMVENYGDLETAYESLARMQKRKGKGKDKSLDKVVSAVGKALEPKTRKAIDDQIASEPKQKVPKGFANIDDFAQQQKGPEGIANTLPPATPTTDGILALLFPELVELATALGEGRHPRVRKALRVRGARGIFRPSVPEIELLAALSEDPQQAAKTLGHEIGHWADYIPEGTFARGNILGHIASMVRYLKHTLDLFPTDPSRWLTPKDRARLRRQAKKQSPDNVKEAYEALVEQELEDRGLVTVQEIRDEAWNLSTIWRPLKPNPTENYIKNYRQTPVEMFADLISAFLNDPGLVERTAPRTYQMLRNHLQKKPEFFEAWEQLQSVAASSPEARTRRRLEGYRAMVRRGDEKRLKNLQRTQDYKLKDVWLAMIDGMIDRNSAWYKLRKKGMKMGLEWRKENDPTYLIEELMYTNSTVAWYLDVLQKVLIEPLREAGIDTIQLGTKLGLKRAETDPEEGGRAHLFNPRGLSGKDAADARRLLEEEFTPKQAEVIDQALKEWWRLRERVFDMIEHPDARPYTDALHDEMRRTLGVYATTQMQKFIEDAPTQLMDATGWVHKMYGTLGDIGNPFLETVLKDLAMVRLSDRTRTIRAAVDFAKQVDPDTVKEAERKGQYDFKPPTDKGYSLVTYLHEGKVKGVYMQDRLAKAFERNEENAAVYRGYYYLTRFMRALMVDHNPFWSIWNLERDTQAFAKNVITGDPLTGFVKAWAYTLSSTPQAWRDVVRDTRSDTMRKMMKEKALIQTGVRFWRFGDIGLQEGLDLLIERYGLTDADHQAMVRNFWTRMLHMTARGAQKTSRILSGPGAISERAVKVAGYRYLKDNQKRLGLTDREIAHMVRTRVGTPDPMRRGDFFKIYNSMFMFSNIAKEGYRSGWESLKENPVSYAGKLIAYDIMPTIFKFMAMEGALDGDGDNDWREFFHRISESHKTNYMVLPVGIYPSGRVGYFIVPHDHIGQVVAAATMAWLQRDEKNLVPELLRVLNAAMPWSPASVHPAFETAFSTALYNLDINPPDWSFFNDIVPKRVWDSGDKSFRTGRRGYMGRWAWNNLGLSVIHHFDREMSEDETAHWFEDLYKYPGLSPLLKRFFRLSDKGVRQRAFRHVKKKRQEETIGPAHRRDNVWMDILRGDKTLSDWDVLNEGKSRGLDHGYDTNSEARRRIAVLRQQMYGDVYESVLAGRPRQEVGWLEELWDESEGGSK